MMNRRGTFRICSMQQRGQHANISAASRISENVEISTQNSIESSSTRQTNSIRDDREMPNLAAKNGTFFEILLRSRFLALLPLAF